MIALGAKPELLARYQELQKSHLTTSTAAFTQGAHDHRASQLPWFWSIDIPRDTSSKSWLTEFSTIHLQKFTESTGSVLKQERSLGRGGIFVNLRISMGHQLFPTPFEMLAGEV
ncbi:hypothetical protein EDD17DRAFT_1515603 [Pisolithus thermaeus]|nr:hypothetical protein EDD17DRAFT_1515603 [Pisolithus thermaeus]